MTVYTNDMILDGGVDQLVADGDVIHLMDAYTTDYATVLATSMGSFTPTLSVANGASQGRVARLGAELAVDITADGTLNHYAIVDSGATTVLCVSEADGKVFNNGDSIDIGQVDVYQVYDTVIAP